MYWRVTGSMHGYTSKTVSRTFVTPETPSFTAAALISPADEAVLGEDGADVNFVATATGADETILEISKTQDFATLTFSGKQWVADAGNTANLSYTVPVTTFIDGTYYWRVRTVKGEMNPGISATRSFDIVNSSAGPTGTEPGYVQYREDYEYPLVADKNGEVTLKLTNLWLRNADHNPLELDANLCRDIAVRAADNVQPYPVVYISCRASNSKTASSYLARYNANTGERMADLPIEYDGNAVLEYFPCNSVIVDDSNNLLVHNLALAGGKSVSLVKVDPISGAGTTMATVTSDYRVDHLAIEGTVSNTGIYYIYAAAGSNANIIFCWRMNNGVNDKTWTKVAKTGAAGRIQALPNDLLLVDGDTGYPQFYPWDDSYPNDDPSDDLDNYGMYPRCYQPTGATAFVHDGQSFVVAPTDGPWRVEEDGTVNVGTEDRYQWSVMTVDDWSAGSFAGMQTAFQFPQGGIGSFYHPSGDFGAPVVLLQDKNAATPHTTLFAYSPGNGKAAYSLAKQLSDGDPTIVNEICPDTNVPVELYNLQGVRVSAANATHGIYIRRQGNTVTKVIL